METKKTSSHNSSDRLFVYFAGVILALLSSPWIAQFAFEQLSRMIPLPTTTNLQTNVSSALFFGISFANPFGTAVYRLPIKRSLAWLCIGLVFGYVSQHYYFTPLAGEDLSTFLHLLLVAVVPTLVMGYEKLELALDAQGIDLKVGIAERVFAFTQWPDRVLFILLMGFSFAIFWRLTNSTQDILIALATVLTVLTIGIAARKWEIEEAEDDFSPDFQAWLDLEPEEQPSLDVVASAKTELLRLARTILPGAILFGGMTRLAVELLPWFYPNLRASLNNPDEMWQTLGIIAASGLGLVFFGIIASLGFSLVLLQLIARLGNWSQMHLRESCYQLLRTLYFRPMRRS